MTGSGDADAEWLVYFGAYTAAGRGRGISVARFDAAEGAFSGLRLAAETESPSFLAVHPTRPFLYAVNEVSNFEGRPAGSVSAFAVDPTTGDLRSLGRASSRGADPCHLVVDPSGSHVLIANYTGGSVASVPVRPDGGLSEADAVVQHTGRGAHPERQRSPHAHMVEVEAAGRFAVVTDLGLDRLLVYGLDSGRLRPEPASETGVAPGSGPRHFAFAPEGRDLYLLNELSLTIVAFRYEAGRLTEFQTTAALDPDDSPRAGDSGAGIVVHPSGRFVYASLRGRDSVAIFTREVATGRLHLTGRVSTRGRGPRFIVIDPGGRFLLVANQRSDQVVVFRIDALSGGLSPNGATLDVAEPVAMAFVPAGGTRF